jgi:hypothetical protein
VDAVQVNPSELQALAGDCHCRAAELTAGNAQVVTGLPFQATAAAVEMTHAAAAAAGLTLAGRMQATAAKLTAASTLFVDQDAEAAVLIEAVADW